MVIAYSTGLKIYAFDRYGDALGGIINEKTFF